MKLIARIFALSLVASSAVASTQIHPSSSKAVVSASMSMLPVACCPPDGSTDCGMGQ